MSFREQEHKHSLLWLTASVTYRGVARRVQSTGFWREPHCIVQMAAPHPLWAIQGGWCKKEKWVRTVLAFKVPLLSIFINSRVQNTFYHCFHLSDISDMRGSNPSSRSQHIFNKANLSTILKVRRKGSTIVANLVYMPGNLRKSHTT